MSDNIRGAFFMIASMVCFAVNDAIIKSLGGVLPVFQTLAVRGGLVVVMLAVLVMRSGWQVHKLGQRDRMILSLRTLSEVGAAFFIVTALFNMELANMNAILQILPLTIPLAAFLFLGEPLGWRRISAISIGFLGMLLIVKPGSDGFNIYSLFCLAAVVCVTIRDLTARSLGAKLSSQEMSFFAAFGVFLAASLAAAFEPWAPVSFVAWTALLGASVAIFFGYIVSVLAIRIGDVSFTAQFRYIGLIAALILGHVFFSEWPDFYSFIGAGVIVGTGAFTIYRQRSTHI
ncbi:MAG: DMT family transporter [Planktomarina sp.]|jgi:S-adenosylmethionine uptake transporter|nr:DMT family transporter [Planktomarina sp.]